MKTDAALLQYITNWDNAATDLLVQLRALGFEGDADNIKICRQAEAKLAEQDHHLKTYKECSDKQLQWIRNAMDAIHPECDVTSNPVSLIGKTLRRSQTAEIERLKEINTNLIDSNERLSARVADWDAVCKALWDRGYGQLDQPINETPLGSCLRLIAEGSPDPANAQAAKPQPDQSNPLFSHVAVHCVDGQVFTTPANEIPWTPWAGGSKPPLNDKDVEDLEVMFDQVSLIHGDRCGVYHLASILDWENGVNVGGQTMKIIAYRVLKWKPVKVPLEATDLPLGTAIRFEADLGSESLITGRNDKFIWLGGASSGVTGAYLMNENAEYRLPGSDEWKPCHKLVNRTPEA